MHLLYFHLLNLIGGLCSATHLPVGLHIRNSKGLGSSLTNIHLTLPPSLSGTLADISYGPCSDSFPHHRISTRAPLSLATRLIWVIPSSAPDNGCLSARSSADGQLLGRSPVPDLSFLRRRQKRDLESIKMRNDTGFDPLGRWFDGVKYLKSRNQSAVDVEKARKKKIGIVGAGIAGLMTGLLLKSVGFENFEILESSQRAGGRIRTAYLEGGPSDYQYQEMGPMRFPYEAQCPETNETLPVNDHRVVFQLVDELNRLNKNKSELYLKAIPFILDHPNTPRYQYGIRNPDGSVPTIEEAATDPRFASRLDQQAKDVRTNVLNKFLNPEDLRKVIVDMYSAHKKFVDDGYDQFSEFYYIHNVLGASLNIADQAKQLVGGPAAPYWTTISEWAYFIGTTFRTIDGGLERIPKAFLPILGNRIRYNRRIRKLDFIDNKPVLSWKTKPTDTVFRSADYDYTIVAAPFTEVRKWRLPDLTPTLRRAIRGLNYLTTCKLALQFRTRFWERLPKAIIGGCTSTDIPGIGSFCYPSFAINSTGPGTVLASYNIGDDGFRYVSMSDEEHVAYVLDAWAEIHGEELVRGQYTGRYARKCWLLDEGISGGWAEPTVGQHELYIPEYFKTLNNTIFVGEHTGYIHGWVAAALESAIRGTVQLCLELGLVDEAKEVVGKWMARWITI